MSWSFGERTFLGINVQCFPTLILIISSHLILLFLQLLFSVSLAHIREFLLFELLLEDILLKVEALSMRLLHLLLSLLL
jgi:hypothetical protein